jgi:F-box-like
MGATNSTAAAVARSTIPQLPNECLLLIFRQSEGLTLKQARLASKAFAYLTEPLLWQTLRIVPNSDCLSSVGELLKHSKVARHVQHLVYDASWEYLIDDFKFKCEKQDVRERIPPTPGCPSVLCSKTLQKAIHAQIRPCDDSAAEVADLARVVLALPNVRKLSVKESHTTHESPALMPFYYQKVCRDAGLSATTLRLSNSFGHVETVSSHTRNFLLAAYSTCREFELVDLRSVAWHTFFRGPVDSTRFISHDLRMRKALFSTLKQLDISFKGSPSRNMDDNLKPLRELLKGCEQLESLYLSFTNIITRRYSADHRSFSYLTPLIGEYRSPRPLMPRIKDLFLNSLFCTQKDLVQILAMHASTLRHVTLSNISLLRHETKDSRGCWVQVIRAMRSLLHLNTVYFSGWLSNGGRQIWHVSEDASEDDRLRPAVVRYILDKTPQVCPLDHVAILPDHDDLDKPTERSSEGDWTWTMTYSSSMSRGEQTHSGQEFFTKDVSLDSDDWALANPQFWKTPFKKTYPTPADPCGSIKLSPNASDWWWSDSSSWTLPSKKGKKKNKWSSNDSWAWEPPPYVDPFSWNTSTKPPAAASPSTSSKASSQSGSSQSSGLNEGHSVHNQDDGDEEIGFVGLSEGKSPPPPPTPPPQAPGTSHAPPAATWKFSELNNHSATGLHTSLLPNVAFSPTPLSWQWPSHVQSGLHPSWSSSIRCSDSVS